MSDIVEMILTKAAMAEVRRQLDGQPIPGVPGPPQGPESWSAEGGSINIALCARAALTALEEAGYVVVKETEIDHLKAVIVQLGDDLGAQNTR